MIKFKDLIQEEDDKFSRDIDKMVAILNSVLNNKQWNDGMSLNFKHNKKFIKEFVETELSPYNYSESIKEELAKIILKLLSDVEKTHTLPKHFVDKRTVYYDIKNYPSWQEKEMEIGKVLRTNLDKTDTDLHGDLIMND